MTDLPNLTTYRPNFSELNIGALTIWFSYETPVAFRHPGIGRVVRQNDWGPTTGKHLNEIDGGQTWAKKSRLPGDEFEARLRGLWSTLAGEVVTS